MFYDSRIEAQKKIIIKLTKENEELKKELNAANERFEVSQREQFQRVQSLDELLETLRGLERVYKNSIRSLDEARESYDAERIKYWELRKEYKKQTDKLIKEFRKGGESG